MQHLASKLVIYFKFVKEMFHVVRDCTILGTIFQPVSSIGTSLSHFLDFFLKV